MTITPNTTSPRDIQAEIDQILEYAGADIFEDNPEVIPCLDIEDIAEGKGPAHFERDAQPVAYLRSIRACSKQGPQANFDESMVSAKITSKQDLDVLPARTARRTHQALESGFFAEHPHVATLLDALYHAFQSFVVTPLQAGADWVEHQFALPALALSVGSAFAHNTQQPTSQDNASTPPEVESPQLVLAAAGVAVQSPYFDSIDLAEAEASAKRFIFAEETSSDDAHLHFDLDQETKTTPVTETDSQETTPHFTELEPAVVRFGGLTQEEPQPEVAQEITVSPEEALAPVVSAKVYPRQVNQFAARYYARQAGLSVVAADGHRVLAASTTVAPAQKKERGFVAFMERLSVEWVAKRFLFVWLTATFFMIGLKALGIAFM